MLLTGYVSVRKCFVNKHSVPRASTITPCTNISDTGQKVMACSKYLIDKSLDACKRDMTRPVLYSDFDIDQAMYDF